MGTTLKSILAIFALTGVLYAKSASEYFVQAGFLYAQAKYPSAAIEAKEGLAKYPSDQKLQRLLKRIEEMQQEQKKQNDKENPGEKSDEQQSSSSQNQGSSGAQSSSSAGTSQAQPQGGKSSQAASSSAAEQPQPDSLQEGQLSKDQAEQLLKDFQENDKERKRATRVRGRATPEKDW